LRKLGAGLVRDLQQFVELGVNCEGIAAIGALDEQRHAPDGQRCDGAPVERLATKREPVQTVCDYDQKRGRMRGERTKPGRPMDRRRSAAHRTALTAPKRS